MCVTPLEMMVPTTVAETMNVFKHCSLNCFIDYINDQIFPTATPRKAGAASHPPPFLWASKAQLQQNRALRTGSMASASDADDGSKNVKVKVNVGGYEMVIPCGNGNQVCECLCVHVGQPPSVLASLSPTLHYTTLHYTPAEHEVASMCRCTALQTHGTSQWSSTATRVPSNACWLLHTNLCHRGTHNRGG